MSWQATAFTWGMRALRLKQRLFGSARAIDATVKRDRKKGPDTPSFDMKKKFNVSDSVVDGRNVTTVAPKNKAAKRTILYLHGGGFVMSITSLHWLLIRRLSHRLDAVVVVPDYPLAPEHSCVESNDWIVRHYAQLVRSVDTSTLSVMGDSAGGHLALALLLQARDKGLPLPSSSVLFSPAVTGDYDHEHRKAKDATDCMIALAGMEPIARLWARDLDVHDPRISLLKASLKGLPPIAVYAGSEEIMSYDAQRIEEKATEEGVDIDVFVYDGMFHAWPIFPIPEARKVVAEVVNFVQKKEQKKKTQAA